MFMLPLFHTMQPHLYKVNMEEINDVIVLAH